MQSLKKRSKSLELEQLTMSARKLRQKKKCKSFSSWFNNYKGITRD